MSIFSYFVFDHVKKSLEADENDFEVLRISSAIAQINKDFNKSIEHAKKGHSINVKSLS